MSVAWVGAGIAAAGAISSASASKKAAGAQQQAAADATALEKYQYDQTRSDNAGYRARGDAAGNRLSVLMGLTPSYGPNGYEENARNFDSAAYLAANPDVADAANWDPKNHTAFDHWTDYGQNEGRTFTPTANALQTAQTTQSTAQGDPAFGSLTRRFSTADLNADPVYQSGLQFGLNEGEKAINNRASAGGSYLSGATLKALTRFGNDYGTTKAADSYGRFTADQTNQYNRLAGIAGTGQQATNQVSAAGQNYANNASANTTGAGNAQAAGIVGGANAINNGIGQGYNMYQNNELMKMIRNPQPNSYESWQTSGSGMPNY